MATSQSIICPLLTPPPYVLGSAGGACGPWLTRRAVVHRLRQPQPARAEAIRSSARRGLAEARGPHLVGHEREGQQPAAGVVDQPGQGGHAAQVAGLGPDQAAGPGAEAAEDALPGASVPEKPATGMPVMAARSRPRVPAEARLTRRASAAGVIRSCGDRPQPSTRWIPPAHAEPAQRRAVTAAAAPLNEAGPLPRAARPGGPGSRRSRCCSRASIQPTIADSGGEETAAIGGRVRGRLLLARAGPATRIPSALRKAAKACRRVGGRVCRAGPEIARVVRVLAARHPGSAGPGPPPAR